MTKTIEYVILYSNQRDKQISEKLKVESKMKRETYEIYISVGTEELKKMFEMYATNDIEIIKQTAKILVNVKCIYDDVNIEIIVKKDNKQILHFSA